MPTQPSSREWNAADYHRLSSPQFHWGQRVLATLNLRGDERVLDAGCGTGRLTEIIAHSLPRGCAVGVDLSTNMLRHSYERLHPGFGDRVQFVAADFCALPFNNAFDGIFSTASFHWVRSHDLLFRNLFTALRPGGWLHAQCGGGNNLARLRARVRELAQATEFRPYLGDFSEPWFFSNDSDAYSRLVDAGFVEVTASLEEAPVHPPSAEEFQGFLRTFILHRHLELLPDENHRNEFVRRLTDFAAADSQPFTLDYWRLNLRARKPH
jgi:trans-aconitate 2-methyltransferase